MLNLKNAIVCIDCEEIFSFLDMEPCYGKCPACASQVIFPLAKWINRKIDGLSNRCSEENTPSATPEAAGLCSIIERSKSK